MSGPLPWKRVVSLAGVGTLVAAGAVGLRSSRPVEDVQGAAQAQGSSPYVGQWTCNLSGRDIELNFLETQSQLRVMTTAGNGASVAPPSFAGRFMEEAAPLCGGRCDLMLTSRFGGMPEPWMTLGLPVNGVIRAASWHGATASPVTCTRTSAVADVSKTPEAMLAKASAPAIDAAERKLAGLVRANAPAAEIAAASDERLAAWIAGRRWEEAGKEVSARAANWPEPGKRLAAESSGAFAPDVAGPNRAAANVRPVYLNNIGVALAEDGWYRSAFAAFQVADQMSRGSEGPSPFQMVVLRPNIERLPAAFRGEYSKQAGSVTARNLLLSEAAEHSPAAMAVWLGALLPSIVTAELERASGSASNSSSGGFIHPLLELKGITTAILAAQQRAARELRQSVRPGGAGTSSANLPRFDRAPEPIALPQGTAVVDLYWYVPTQEGTTRLLAFVGTNERTVRIELGAATPIIEAVAAWQESASRRSGTPQDVEQKWQAITRLLWAPIRANAAVARASEVVVVPDQYLDELPWGLFREGNGAAIRIVDAPRDLVPRPPPRGARGHTVVVEQVDYGTGVGQRKRLPGGELTAADCASYGQSCTERLMGNSVTRAALDKAVVGARLVHFDTHGETVATDAVEGGWHHWPWIVYPPDAIVRAAASIGEFRETLIGGVMRALGVDQRRPATSAFLALSGANTAPSTLPETNPGTLTDMEIAGLDFSALDLVVFSACDSGRQLRIAYQGLVSLRSAAQAAGARSVMMALWQVEPEATTLLVREFYRQHLGLKKRKAESLRAAQNMVRAIPRFEHPYFWAGWIVVGADDGQ